MARGIDEGTKITLSAKTWIGLVVMVACSTGSVVWGYSRIEARVSQLEYRYDADLAAREAFRQELLAALGHAGS